MNPHIPQFMSNAPWYLAEGTGGAPLGHLKNWKGGEGGEKDKWYVRGKKTFQATKFRKGACENCGSMSHKTPEVRSNARGPIPQLLEHSALLQPTRLSRDRASPVRRAPSEYIALVQCVERPRKKGAKWTGKDIAADEYFEDVDVKAYDAKRDRWNGYDASDYQQTVDRYERLQELQKKAVIQKLMEVCGGGPMVAHVSRQREQREVPCR